MIRLSVPTIEEDDLQAVREALSSGFLVQGARVRAFEEEVARYVGIGHAVAVSNGTAALHLSLLALGIEPDDLVVVTAYSWLATANVIELCRARPVFLDIEPRTYNLDPGRLQEEVARLKAGSTTGARLKAILPVHAFGQMADMPAIMEVANRFEIPVIEDAACALGARRCGRAAGTWGRVGCFSFHPRKAITTGEGGLVVTDDEALARRLRVLRNHGQAVDANPPDFVLPGFNYRLTEFQAALGLTQMKKADRLIAARRRLGAGYDRLLQGTNIEAPFRAPDAEHVYQSYVTRLPASLSAVRSELVGRLKEQGIETTIGTWHMPMTTFFREKYGFAPGDFPASEEAFARSLSLPLYAGLTDADQAFVIGALVSIAQRLESCPLAEETPPKAR